MTTAEQLSTDGPTTVAAELWWILEGGFRWSPPRAGSLYSGPYSTREDAFTARRKLEQILGHNQLFIEQQPVLERTDALPTEET